MEEKRVGIIKSFLNVIKSLTSKVDDEGKIDESRLTSAEQKELEKIRASGNIKEIEEELLSKKLGYAKVDSKKAVRDAAEKAVKKADADNDKTKPARPSKEIAE